MLILVACFPKSGSTFLTSVITNLPGFTGGSFTAFHGSPSPAPTKPGKEPPLGSRKEQELCRIHIKQLERFNAVAQHHVAASYHTMALIDEFNISPIVLVRNIYDALLSLAEHIVIESPEMPFAYFDDSIKEKDIEYRINAVTDLVSPWFIKFYVSWVKNMPGAIVRYEDVILGGSKSIYGLLSGIRKRDNTVMVGDKVSITETAVENAIIATSGQNTRFNVGVAGRGERIFSEDNKSTIRRLASYYPDVDFGPIGL
jgi:hypothetical protein